MKNKKPRNKKYRGATDCYNPIDLARNAARTISPKVQAELIAPAVAGYHKLRQGIAERNDWNMVIDVLNAGEALAELHIGDNLLPEYHAAFKAMHDVALRMLDGKGSTCRMSELEAISNAINCYGVQIKLCSQSEYNRAVARVQGMLRNGRHVTMKAEHAITKVVVA